MVTHLITLSSWNPKNRTSKKPRHPTKDWSEWTQTLRTLESRQERKKTSRFCMRWAASTKTLWFCWVFYLNKCSVTGSVLQPGKQTWHGRDCFVQWVSFLWLVSSLLSWTPVKVRSFICTRYNWYPPSFWSCETAQHCTFVVLVGRSCSSGSRCIKLLSVKNRN